jgi:hypothetical protein
VGVEAREHEVPRPGRAGEALRVAGPATPPEGAESTPTRP